MNPLPFLHHLRSSGLSVDYRLALLGKKALDLVVMEILYEACPLSRANDLSVSI
jgi:hypothetical protein